MEKGISDIILGVQDDKPYEGYISADKEEKLSVNEGSAPIEELSDDGIWERYHISPEEFYAVYSNNLPEFQEGGSDSVHVIEMPTITKEGKSRIFTPGWWNKTADKLDNFALASGFVPVIGDAASFLADVGANFARYQYDKNNPYLPEWQRKDIARTNLKSGLSLAGVGALAGLLGTSIPSGSAKKAVTKEITDIEPTKRDIKHFLREADMNVIHPEVESAKQEFTNYLNSPFYKKRIVNKDNAIQEKTEKMRQKSLESIQVVPYSLHDKLLYYKEEPKIVDLFYPKDYRLIGNRKRILSFASADEINPKDFKYSSERTIGYNNPSGIRLLKNKSNLKNTAVHELSHDTDFATNNYFLKQNAFTKKFTPLYTVRKKIFGDFDEEINKYLNSPTERRARMNSILTDIFSQGYNPNSLIDRMKYLHKNYNKEPQLKHLREVYGIPRLLYYSGKVYNEGGEMF